MKIQLTLQKIIALICLISAVSVLSCSTKKIRIVDNGKPNAVITLRQNASDHELLAANLLAEYIGKSTGAEIPVERDVRETETIVIHVGEDEYVHSRNLDLSSLDGDGYYIDIADKNIVIAGPTDWGTEYGVYEFLERFVGVRWLMAGKYGEDVPIHSTLEIPVGTFRDEPVFFSRQLSSPNGPVFVRRNRHRARVSFHHNLLHLFPASTYTKTNPEFFPIWDGKRYLPKTDTDFHWQPCFSADGIIEEAVKNIKNYFKGNPKATSYSLGMNDTDHFCQCEKCLAKEAPEKNFLGYRNYSDSYFEWANAVAASVLEEYPDKWFGTLAYWSLVEPPRNVKVHPRIIPYMTYGRIRWFDPDIEAEGHRMTELWKSMSPTLGWYDYIYGSPYIVPRVFFHRMADYLRYGAQTGVRASYGEIYYNWGEGPKEYITLKLLWNPRLDVDAALDDWYEHAVGKAAAPYLKAYYDHWEKFWTERITQSSWYTKEHQWMKFYNPGYVDIITEQDITQSRTWLEEAVSKAETEPQKKRAELLLKAFDYYEASTLSFMDELRAFTSPPESEEQALASLDSVERYMSMKARWRKLVNDYSADPVLNMPIKPDRYHSSTGDRWGCYPLWSTFEWAREKDGVVRKRLGELTASSQGTVRNHAVLMRDILEGATAPVSDNSTFDRNIKGWNIIKKSNERVTWSESEGHIKPGAFTVHNAVHILCDQKIRLSGKSDYYTCLGFVKVEGTDSGDGIAELIVTATDTIGKDTVVNEWLGATDWHMTSIKPSGGRWIPISTSIDISQIKVEKKPEQLEIRLILRDFAEGTKVFVDDFGLYEHVGE